MITLNNPVGLGQYIVWLFAIIAICYGLKKKYPWTVVLAFGFTAFSSIRIYQNALNGIPSNPIIQQFDFSAQGAMIALLLTILAVHAFSIQTWIKIFKFVGFANAVVICGDFIFHLPSGIFVHEPWGILLNASMSGCLNAVIFQLINGNQKKDRGFKILLIASVVLTGRSLPIAVLFCGIGAALLLQKRFRDFAFAVLGSIACGFAIKGNQLFAPRARDLIWSQAAYYFRDHLNWAFGSGLGGFFVIGPILTQQNLNFSFIWLHSDWLQILFETGIIGFLLVIAMYGEALWRARKTPPLFSALVAFVAFGVANMPLRYPIAGIFGAFLIRWALENPRVSPNGGRSRALNEKEDGNEESFF